MKTKTTLMVWAHGLVFLGSVMALSGIAEGAEPLIPAGSMWKYLDTGTDPGSVWVTAGFNDATWPVGPAQLGFGDGDEATVIRSGIVTAYFRRKFTVTGAAQQTNLTLRVLRDDGVAVYVNGAEVYRNNLPSGPLTYNTLAITAVGGAEETTVFLSAPLSPGVLVEGENVVAAEVHQVNITSSDLSFDLELLSGGTTNTNPPPPELPIVTIESTDSTAGEQSGDTATFRISRTGSTVASLSVNVSYGGSAINGVDTIALPGVVEIPAGASFIELSVQPIDDVLVEGAENLVCTVIEPACATQNPSAAGCYRVGTPGQAAATILDNDPPPPPPLRVTLIPSNSVWKYLDDGSDQGTAWREPAFEDSAWASGPGQLGYGDGDEATVVSFGPDLANKYITTYFRRAFDAGDRSTLSNLVLHVLRDDGVAVYLNGVEVYRNNLAPDATATTLATSVAVDENAYLEASISAAALVNGLNVIAAEIHQVNPVSSDIGFDLELSAEGTLTPPPDPCALGPSPDDQMYAAVASDGSGFLVVWQDRRNLNSTDYDIYGARISASGDVLDPGGIPICTAVDSQWYPAVAFDGSNYLVVWSDGRNSGALDVFGARVSSSGVVLDPNGFPITHGEAIYQPTVAFNGIESLVTGYSWEHNGGRGVFVLGARVTPGGVVRDTEELVIHQTSGDAHPVAVASRGGEWLVVWNFGAGGVQGARVAPDGSASSAFQILTSGATWAHGLTATTERYFLTTIAPRVIGANTYVLDVFGSWLRPDGTALNTFEIAANTNQTVGSSLQSMTYIQERPAAMASGSDVFVVWEAGSMYTNGGTYMYLSDIRGARAAANGGVSPVQLICGAPQDQSWPAVGFNGHHFVAAWHDARTAPPTEYAPLGAFDIYAAQIPVTGEPIEANGFLVSGSRDPGCDTDGDGVFDEVDACPGTLPGSVVDGHGCAIDQLCPCDGPWPHHGDYVNCVIERAWAFFREGLFTAARRQAIIRDASQSDCGTPEGPRVHAQPQNAAELQVDGRCLVLSGPVGRLCVLECSSDLQQWTPIWTNPLPNVSVELEDRNPHGTATRFYRVRIQP